MELVNEELGIDVLVLVDKLALRRCAYNVPVCTTNRCATKELDDPNTYVLAASTEVVRSSILH